MRNFKENESFEHKIAKELLTLWLREAEDGKFDGISCDFCGLRWNKNAGVFPELPFYETSHPYYFENSGGLDIENYQTRHDYATHHIKGFDKGKTLFIPDITIFQRGYVILMIEIVHKSPLTEKKINTMTEFFKDTEAELYTINSRSIMVNTSKPTWLNFQKIF